MAINLNEVTVMRISSFSAFGLWLSFGLPSMLMGYGAAEVVAQERPNIVFFFSDDLTTQAISAYRYGLELPPTPNIDRLAEEGMLFENSFCGNSICTPSRCTVMTGLHSHKSGIVNLSGALDPRRPTWPKALQKGSYSTAIFGKWHMKTKPTGFDEWAVLSGQGNYYNPDFFFSDTAKAAASKDTRPTL
jgi:arylsulfatase A-like enzyme